MQTKRTLSFVIYSPVSNLAYLDVDNSDSFENYKTDKERRFALLRLRKNKSINVDPESGTVPKRSNIQETQEISHIESERVVFSNNVSSDTLQPPVPYGEFDSQADKCNISIHPNIMNAKHLVESGNENQLGSNNELSKVGKRYGL
ncbi:hypothetical protein PIB30_067753 [Stylosanthes scabra]|uniref:Uncharacterized protein n=1 Tax=Stylosanthes scabra TaxID=79078 RepID=A0ABU6RN89_9FABA|nr:hypothetical protein [Stylosanthes scabra]